MYAEAGSTAPVAVSGMTWAAYGNARCGWSVRQVNASRVGMGRGEISRCPLRVLPRHGRRVGYVRREPIERRP